MNNFGFWSSDQLNFGSKPKWCFEICNEAIPLFFDPVTCIMTSNDLKRTSLKVKRRKFSKRLVVVSFVTNLCISVALLNSLYIHSHFVVLIFVCGQVSLAET